MAVFKIKALRNWSPIIKGMEVEIVKKHNYCKPTQVEIKEAFSQKYNIKAPAAIYYDKSNFEIYEN